MINSGLPKSNKWFLGLNLISLDVLGKLAILKVLGRFVISSKIVSYLKGPVES